MYKTVIIDDEKHHQDILSGLLKQNYPNVELSSVCSSVEEGVTAIERIHPHLIFLDVVIPPYTAFDLLARINKRDFDIIFMSSYEKYAVNAFKVSAVDYLLKPFGPEELAAAFLKFEERRKLKQAFDHIGILLENIRNNTSSNMKIALPTQTGFHFIRLGEITHCEADNNYTVFHLLDKTSLLVSRSIRECEDLLLDFNFYRIHNSFIVNLFMVREYVRGDGGHIKLHDGTTIMVARSKKDGFLEVFNKI